MITLQNYCKGRELDRKVRAINKKIHESEGLAIEIADITGDKTSLKSDKLEVYG